MSALNDIKLSIMRGLWYNAFHSLRGITVDILDSTISVMFYINNELTEENKESCELVLDDFFGDFNITDIENLEFDIDFKVLNVPTPLPNEGTLIYHRYEPNLKLNKPNSINFWNDPKHSPDINLLVNLKLAVFQAMIGNVFPQLRAISGQVENSCITLNIYHEFNLEELQLSLCNTIIDETKEYLKPLNPNWIIHLIQLNPPQKVPLIGHWLFLRREPP